MSEASTTAPHPDTDGVVAAFRRAARFPWYRQLLDERGVAIDRVVDLRSFVAACPLLDKRNTFERFPIHELAASTPIRELAGVLTSSGHGGRFSFGLITRAQAAEGGRTIDLALDAAFGVASRATLAINCLPMGVGFSSERMTVATTSVREDMAVALVEQFGRHYEQILLVSDPLFVKRLLDYARSRGVDWTRYRMQVVLGEEVFGENLRSYVAAALGLDVECPDDGYVMSSFGVGELGLHLCFETPATIALRRAIARNPALGRALAGWEGPADALPAMLTWHPPRTFLEIVDAGSDGYGPLAISMLDPEVPVPLLRYQTGDVARVLDAATVERTLRDEGVTLPGPLPAALLALRGRAREALPHGSHVAVYKDAIYADPRVALSLSGAVRILEADGGCELHVQLAPDAAPDASLEGRLMAVMPAGAKPARIVLWRYAEFPYGMTLDYERKFSYYARP